MAFSASRPSVEWQRRVQTCNPQNVHILAQSKTPQRTPIEVPKKCLEMKSHVDN